jgi:alcohol dehydrogenase (cytochrome c)
MDTNALNELIAKARETAASLAQAEQRVAAFSAELAAGSRSPVSCGCGPETWKTGGGGLWQTGSYDPVNKLTIWGTGNPVPEFDPQARPGDNLYTNSAVALDVNTGMLVWYFQYLPNDSWDYDEVGVHMLYDINVNGEMRKVMGHFGRNGFFYTLDRANGSFVKGGQYVNDLNWTKGLDPKTGKPIEYDPGRRAKSGRSASSDRRATRGLPHVFLHVEGGLNP